jgi:rod shape-determining protein MreD
VLASLVFVLLALLALVIERSLLARLPFSQPDLLALVLASGALGRGPRVAAVWGLSAGILADLVPPAGGVAGLWAFAYASAGFVVSLVAHAERSRRHDPFRRSAQDPRRSRGRLIHGLAAAAASLLATVLHLVGVAAIGPGAVEVAGGSVLTTAVGTAYAFVVGFVLGRPLTRLLAPTTGVAW